MAMIFFLILFILPVTEIALFIAIGGEIGVWNTILLCVLAAVAGSFIVKIQGIRTFAAMKDVAGRGKIPLQEMFDGFCLAAAGLFLMIPGFFSDMVAFALMVPPLRTLLREALVRRYGFHEMTGAEEDVIEAEFRRVETERIERHE